MTNQKSKSDLQQHVDHIASNIQNGYKHEYCPECSSDISNGECAECQWAGDEIMSGFDYLQDALDIQYIVTGTGDYIAARVLVAFGGPNIWINTQTKTVEGYWWGDSAFASYHDDPMDINGACEELWGCR